MDSTEEGKEGNNLLCFIYLMKSIKTLPTQNNKLFNACAKLGLPSCLGAEEPHQRSMEDAKVFLEGKEG